MTERAFPPGTCCNLLHPCVLTELAVSSGALGGTTIVGNRMEQQPRTLPWVSSYAECPRRKLEVFLRVSALEKVSGSCSPGRVLPAEVIREVPLPPGAN